jgi:hypothetical protein
MPKPLQPVGGSSGEPPPPPLAEESDMPPAAKAQRLRLEGEQGDRWKVFELPDGIGSLHFDPFNVSYGAHCGFHKQCRINRVCAKRPIGYLMAWLLAGDPNIASSTHKDVKLQRGEGEPMSLDNRAMGREYFKSLPGSATWLAREPRPPTGEHSEPETI